MNSHEKFLLTLAVCVCLSGCANRTIKLYSGPELPKDQVATVVTTVGDIAWQHLKIDGRPIPIIREVGPEFGSLRDITLMPGNHRIEWTRPGGNWTHELIGNLNAKPGHIYDSYFCCLEADAKETTKYYHYKLVFMQGVAKTPISGVAAWMEDRSTGEVVLGNRPSWLKAYPCATRGYGYPMYGGSSCVYLDRDIPDESVATIFGPVSSGVKIDGELVKYEFANFKLPPGLHRIEWSLYPVAGMRIRASWRHRQVGEFLAKPGHTYAIYQAFLPEASLAVTGLAVTGLAGVEVFYVESETSWLQDMSTSEVLVGNKPSWTESGRCYVYTGRYGVKCGGWSCILLR